MIRRWALFFFSLLALLSVFRVGCYGLPPVVPKPGGFEYTHKPAYDGKPKRVISIWIDKDFVDYDQKYIAEAVTNWNLALNGYIKLRIVSTSLDLEGGKVDELVAWGGTDGWVFLKIDHNNTFIPKAEEGYHVLGFTEHIGGRRLMLVRDRINYYDVEGVTMHEIGHLLGSPHVGDRLMHPVFETTRGQCIDWDTIAAVAKYQKLPVDRLNFCVDKIEANDDSKEGLEVLEPVDH
jgi:hypothetical protein